MASTVELASSFIEGAPPGEVCESLTLSTGMQMQDPLLTYSYESANLIPF